MSFAFQVEGLVKRFGSTTALAGVDLAAPTGSILGVLGPNGAGKTTAVRILATLLRPDAGTATVAGFDLLRQPVAVRSRIGLTGQYASVDEDLTGAENLFLIGRLLEMSRRDARARAAELLERFNLTDVGGRAIKTQDADPGAPATGPCRARPRVGGGIRRTRRAPRPDGRRRAARGRAAPSGARGAGGARPRRRARPRARRGGRAAGRRPADPPAPSGAPPPGARRERQRTARRRSRRRGCRATARALRAALRGGAGLAGFEQASALGGKPFESPRNARRPPHRVVGGPCGCQVTPTRRCPRTCRRTSRSSSRGPPAASPAPATAWLRLGR